MKKVLFPYIILLFPVCIFSQVFFNKVPSNRQLYARDTISNLAEVEFEGDVDSYGTPYQKLVVETFKNNTLQSTTDFVLNYDSYGYADFSFSININAELSNYKFYIYGVENSTSTLIKTVNDVVAGDVYIIQGQSNAVAKQYIGSANSDSSNFIRAFERGYVDTNRNQWFIAQGDGDNGTNGNVGQWGLKLAKMIIDTYQVPVAIFNGARGGRPISYFLAPVNYKTSITSNYSKLYYRLDYTNLKDKVRAIFWSQGENTGGLYTLNSYESKFLQLKSSWLNDYPNVKHIYIFQTKLGCYSSQTLLQRFRLSQEPQRRLAEANPDISIMSTYSLTQNSNDYCHFEYDNGYKIFAKRIFELVKRDFYGGVQEVDITPPMVKDIYKYGNNKLVIETDAQNLSIDNSMPEGFQFENNSNVSITNIEVKGSKIIISYSGTLTNNTQLSFLGPQPGINGNFIKNTKNIELICFAYYPIGNKPNCGLSTNWNGSVWSNGKPNPYTKAIFSSNYSTLNNGSISSCDCEINNGVTLTINTSDYLAASGDLIINGTLDLQDDSSLYMFNNDSQITYNGNSIIHKNSTTLNNSYDFTYWSSPVENDIVSNVFSGVDPSRIFHWETPTNGNPGYWVNSNQNEVLTPGKGYISEAPANAVQHDLTFTGKPNNGIITLNLGYDATNGLAGGYNLIGNPYPSSIDILKFLDYPQNNFLDGTIWLWTHATPHQNGVENEYAVSDYATYNRTGGTSNNPNVPVPQNNIASGQGFFVKATQAGNIEFNNEMRLTNQNSTFFKKTKYSNTKKVVDRIWLNIQGSKSKLFNQLLIGFSSHATDQFDKSFDGLKFSSGYLSFYSKLGNDKYAIQSLGEFTSSKSINIGFDTSQKDIYTISIGKIEGILEENEIYLVDNKLNIIHDLKHSDYDFEIVNSGNFSDRFILKFNSSVLNNQDLQNKNQIVVKQIDGDILVNTTHDILQKVSIYDILGRNILEKNNINKKDTRINYPKPSASLVHIISVTLKNGYTFNKKIIIK